jgi:hypothetical protein
MLGVENFRWLTLTEISEGALPSCAFILYNEAITLRGADAPLFPHGAGTVVQAL